MKKSWVRISAESVISDLQPIVAAEKAFTDVKVFEFERDLPVGDCDRNYAVFIVFVFFGIDLRLTEKELS